MLLLLLACTVEPAPPAVPPEQRDTAGDTDVDTLPACADGLPARAFDPAGTGADYLGVAPDFVLPTQSGDWSLAEHWTGCDSYLFLGIDADDGYTGLLLAENAKKLFTQGPANVHYFFFATARATEAEAAQAGIAAVLEEGLASLNADAEAWWRERVHVVTSTTQQTDGWVGALLSAYQYPTFGIDRAQTIREVGYLANPGNGWTTVEWPALGYEAERGQGASRQAAHAAAAHAARGRAPELERPLGAGVPGRRLRVPRLRRPARAPLRRGQPAGHPAHPRRAAPRDRPPSARPRGRRPEGVNTRDRGRSRGRGMEKASFRAPATG